MADLVASDDLYDADGLVESTLLYDDGTAKVVDADGATVETRPQTPGEAARVADYLAEPVDPDLVILVPLLDLLVAKKVISKSEAATVRVKL